MEDDSRDWDKNRERLLANLMNPKQRQKIGQRIEGADNDVDWQRVGDLAHSPRAIPVPVTGNQPGMDAVLGRSLQVENTLPEGSNWDGKTGLLVDEKTFNELVNGKSQAPPVAPPASPASAPTSPAVAAEPSGSR
jgi:hypothetical protein